MITDISFKDIFDRELSEYVAREKNRFSCYATDFEVDKTSLHDIIFKIRAWSRNAEDLKDVFIEEYTPHVKEEIERAFEPEIEDYESRVSDLKRKLMLESMTIRSQKQDAIDTANAALDDYKRARMKELNPLIHAYSELRHLRPDIEKIFQLYGLPIDGVTIQTSAMSSEELMELIKEAGYAVDTIIGTHSIFQKVCAIFYLPSFIHMKDEQADFIFKICYCIAFILLCYLLKPYFIAIVAIFYFISMFSNLANIKERRELLQMAYALSNDIDIQKFISNDKEYGIRMKQVADAEAIDTDAALAALKDKYELDLKLLSKEDPRLDLNKMLAEWSAYIMSTEGTGKIDAAVRLIQAALGRLKDDYNDRLQELADILVRIHDSSKFLGDEIKNSHTMDLNIRLGVVRFNDLPIREAFVTYPLKSIVFQYDSSQQRNECISYMKLLLCNMLCNAKEKYVDVTIVDVNELGKDFTEFMEQPCEGFIHIVTKDFQKELDTIMTDSAKRVKKVNNDDIQVYNTQSDAIGKITLEYKVVILVSTGDDLIGKKQLRSWLDYCASIGIFCWVLVPGIANLKPDDNEKREGIQSFCKDLAMCKGYGHFYNAEGALLDSFDEFVEPYRYTVSMGVKVMDTLIKCLKSKTRNSILSYEDKYRTKVIPDKDIFRYNTRKGIELRFGFVDGDPSKAESLVLGDDTVHALLGGSTGSGKSATINFILMNLLYMYPPEELQLVMVDFKNVEFSRYTGDNLIPHAQIIAGTEDGEYALSIFEYLLDEMHRRQRLCKAEGVKDIGEYNAKMEQLGRKKDILPRMLVLFDEFQQMFFIDPKLVDKITDLIAQLAKLARAFGCHMWFTSQSMEGTLKADVLDQFKLRAALASSGTASSNILGNNAATTIKEKGQIYTNSTGGNDPKANKLWRIPYIDTPGVNAAMHQIIAKCNAEGHIHRHADFYDEKVMHCADDLLERLNIPQIKADPGCFVAGERTAYSTNRAPNNFRVIADDNENILLAAFEKMSLANLMFTMIYNIKSKENVDLVVHCLDSGFRTLMGFEDYVDDKVKPFLSRDITPEDVISAAEDEIKYRLAHPEKKHNQLYFLLVNWDKVEGIGVNENYNLRDRLADVLRKGGQLGIHVILAVREFKNLRSLSTFFNHRLCSYISENESLSLIDSTRLCKIKPEFAIYLYATDTWKCKIYQFEMHGEIEKRTITIT